MKAIAMEASHCCIKIAIAIANLSIKFQGS
jgi:hypothetical protein